MDTLHMLTEPIRKANARRLQEETNGLIKELFTPLYYKKGGRQMYVKIKRMLAVITRAKRRILYSKWKEVMEDKCAPCDSYKHVHLSISGNKFGVLIGSKNGQI